MTYDAPQLSATRLCGASGTSRFSVAAEGTAACSTAEFGCDPRVQACGRRVSWCQDARDRRIL
eukprot:3929690-Prymnesium_polylepis.1